MLLMLIYAWATIFISLASVEIANVAKMGRQRVKFARVDGIIKIVAGLVLFVSGAIFPYIHNDKMGQLRSDLIELWPFGAEEEE